MSVFDDKKYNQLDWLSQATEVYITNIGGILGTLPDSVPVTFDDMKKYSETYGVSYLDKESIVDQHITPLIEEKDYDVKKAIRECYSLEMVGNPVFNLVDSTLTGGTVNLVKTKTAFSDQELHEWIAERAMARFHRKLDIEYATAEIRGRLHEVMELAGLTDKEHFQTKSINKKLSAFEQFLRDRLISDAWKIRDQETACKIIGHLTNYVSTGNLSSIATFCKFKVMTHKGLPIYSVEDVV